MEGKEYFVSEPIDLISGAHVLAPGYNPELQYDIAIDDSGRIKDISRHASIPVTKIAATGVKAEDRVLDASNYLIAPSLCHAHVHLDKCFLLSDPKFADLEIVNGDFAEAMKLTSEAKTRFERDDLLRRGKWLVGESIAAGVTHMRAFVEVDHIVEIKCLDAACELKKLFASACDIQICVFAQEALFSGDTSDSNKRLIDIALANPDVAAIGSTPYVEDSEGHRGENIQWTVEKALKHHLHLDFHLDYNLNKDQAPLTSYVVDLLNDGLGERKYEGQVALGHCTRLTQYSSEEWTQLSEKVKNRPFHFIGLPTSDLFIQGKPSVEDGGGERPRGTLQIPQMIQRYDIQGAISINNVGNAFTPYGSCDPLSIASMGVGLYHAGTKIDAQVLYDCVSTMAKAAIGYSNDAFAIGTPADFVLFDMGGSQASPLSKQRGRKTLQEVVYDPPKGRMTVFKGCVIDA